MWRKGRIALGGPLGVVLGAAYYVFLRAVNADKTPERWSGETRFVFGARCLPPMAAAITYGRFVFFRAEQPAFRLVEHEMVHVAQYRRWGFFGFLWRYGRDIAANGYKNSVIENEARSHES